MTEKEFERVITQGRAMAILYRKQFGNEVANYSFWSFMNGAIFSSDKISYKRMGIYQKRAKEELENFKKGE